MFKTSNLKLPTGQMIDLELNAGEIHCLHGDSGVGKTRLLRALADLDPCTGHVSLDGEDRSAVSGPQWRSRVMLVPARPRWWLATASEHMARDMSSEAAAIKLNSAPMNGPIERLSSGESSRLALLRALSREPDMLLLDEPTAALDEAATAEVETLIRRYTATRQHCVLWITHSRAQAARVADVQWRLTATTLERLT